MKIISPYISLSSNVRHRKEHFGGIVFNTATGTMADLDKEAYLFLLLVESVGVFDINDAETNYSWFGNKFNPLKIEQLIKDLLNLEILVVMPRGKLNMDCNNEIKKNGPPWVKWPTGRTLTAPETVHWAVTYKCDSHCPDCYIRRHSYKPLGDLDTNQAVQVIDKIAAAVVFQLAIGGGEPFLRKDIIELAGAAGERGLVLHITTGRYRHDPEILRGLSKYVKVIQIGIKQDQLMAEPLKAGEELGRLSYMLGEQNIATGANLILSRPVMASFDRIINTLCGAGFKRITLLRYKPPGDMGRWRSEKPGEEDLSGFEQEFPNIINKSSLSLIPPPGD